VFDSLQRRFNSLYTQNQCHTHTHTLSPHVNEASFELSSPSCVENNEVENVLDIITLKMRLAEMKRRQSSAESITPLMEVGSK